MLSLQTVSAKLSSLDILLGLEWRKWKWKWRSSITRMSAQVSLSSSQAGSVAYVGCISCQHALLQNWHCTAAKLALQTPGVSEMKLRGSHKDPLG